MVHPENISSHASLFTELADVQRKLEQADENENMIERFFQRDELLERRDILQTEIASSEPTQKED